MDSKRPGSCPSWTGTSLLMVSVSSLARKYRNYFKEAGPFSPLCSSQSWPRHFPWMDQGVFHVHDWTLYFDTYFSTSSCWKETLKYLCPWASLAEPLTQSWSQSFPGASSREEMAYIFLKTGPFQFIKTTKSFPMSLWSKILFLILYVYSKSKAIIATDLYKP